MPCGAEIPFQVGVCFQLRICVRRKHFAVGIDVDSFPFCLFQKKQQVFQVVSADHDKRSFLHCKRHGDRHRIPVVLSVCLIQKRHTFQIDLAHFHYDGKKLLHVQVFADGEHSFIEECIDFLVRISQNHSVIRICRHSPETEQNEGFQRADILVGIPQQFHIVILRFAARLRAASTAGDKSVFLSCYIFNLLTDRFFVKVYIGDRCEQPFDHCPVSGWGGDISADCAGKADQGACKLILKSGHICGLSTHAGISGASGTSCSLFTLKTKHFI